MTSPLLKIENLSKDHPHKVLFKNLNFEIFEKDFLSVLGSSGCGKSTLLRILCGLEKDYSGSVTSVRPLRVSFVFQEPALLSWRRVDENVALPFELLGEKTNPEKVSEVLKIVGLTDARFLFPSQLSGGMKMRVSFARALVTEPELVLMDEPFAALDEVTRFQLQDELLKIQKRLGLSIVFVTHSVSEAVYLARRAFLLSENPQEIVFDLPEEKTQEIKVNKNYNNYVSLLSQSLRGLPR